MRLHWFSPWYFPPSCPCLCPGAAPPLQTGCSLGAHQHLLPQLQHWTCLAPCKWMGKGPASPSGASSVVTTMVLALDPTPIRGIQEQTGFHFVVFLVWFTLAGICLPPSHLARLTAGKELHKSTTFLILFCISPWPFITEG